MVEDDVKKALKATFMFIVIPLLPIVAYDAYKSYVTKEWPSE